MSSKLDMKYLVDELNRHTELYDKGCPEISDAEWDRMYFELDRLERDTGVIYPESPTQRINFKKVSELLPVIHSHPMLSLAKVHTIKDTEDFLGIHEWIAMCKMDGLTCSLTYDANGWLIRAETRGNGTIGEDITHNARIMQSIPTRITPQGKEIWVDGEVICTYNDFEEFEKDYKNPRNFAAGSIRLYDSNECAKRNLTFVAWDVFNIENCDLFEDKLQWLNKQYFLTVPWISNFGITNEDYSPFNVEPSIEYAINYIKGEAQCCSYPIDGVVFKYNNCAEYDACGRTEHHFKGGIAFKFYNELIPTTLLDIEWTMGRYGSLCPVAIYQPIELLGSTCTRASLHNISIMRDTLGPTPWKGQIIKIEKKNDIIPQIVVAEDKLPTEDDIIFKPIENCPYCGAPTTIKKSDSGTEELYCTNDNCDYKLTNRIDHFFGKKGLDIKGLGKTTIEHLISYDWINCITDVFELEKYKDEWIKKPGYGAKSVNNILETLKNGSITTLSKLICALGIPEIGKTASRTIAAQFTTWGAFMNAIDNHYGFSSLDGIGDIMNYHIHHFDYCEVNNLIKNGYISIGTELKQEKKIQTLNNENICITGTLKLHKNRAELKAKLEALGAKVTDSVTSKTTMLINNDINSTSAKNKKAKELGIKIITEESLINLLSKEAQVEEL